VFRRSLKLMRDLFIFFKAGHSGYLSFAISLFNFAVIQHRLLISQIPMFSQALPSLTSFLVFFIVTYIPLAIVIGVFEFRKGTRTRTPKLNPYIQSVVESTVLFREGFLEGDEEKIRESIVIMEKWRR